MFLVFLDKKRKSYLFKLSANISNIPSGRSQFFAQPFAPIFGSQKNVKSFSWMELFESDSIVFSKLCDRILQSFRIDSGGQINFHNYSILLNKK